MKKKILSFLIAMTAVTGCIGGYSASADENEYLGYNEWLNRTGYIIKVKDINKEVTSKTFGIDDPDKCYHYELYPVKMTGGKDIGYDSFYKAYFNDEQFDEYEKSDEITGYYYSSTSKDKTLKADENINIEEVYYEYTVCRNGLFLYYGSYISNLLGGGHSKLIKADEIIENDVNGDGEVNSEDALKLLNVLVGNDTLTIKEKINLGIYTSQLNPEYAEYKVGGANDIKETLSADKALEILYQIVGE